MSEYATEVIQLCNSEIEQIGESASCAPLYDSKKVLSDEEEGIGGKNEGSYCTGEERAKATNGDESVGRED